MAFCFLAPESRRIPDLKTPDTPRPRSTTPILTWKTRRPQGERKKGPVLAATVGRGDVLALRRIYLRRAVGRLLDGFVTLIRVMLEVRSAYVVRKKKVERASTTSSFLSFAGSNLSTYALA
jgi:hypothetical protein